MLRFLLCAALAISPAMARADASGEIDWQRRVLKAKGEGAPDLNAPSIAVARLGAERAAMATAQRNALETLKGATLEDGLSVGTLLQNDNALRVKVQGKLRGVKAIKTHYFSDGGVSLDIEVPLDQLPPEIGQHLKAPKGAAAPAQGPAQSPAPGGEAKDGLQSIEATGQAAVLNGDKGAAREKAIDDALRQAVKMVAGAQVQSTTEVQDFQTKMDTVLEHSTGYVKSYQIVKEGMDGEVVQVTVRAQVSLAALDKDLEGMGLLMARKGFPRTMVLIAEQNIGMTAPVGPWMKNEQVSADLRIAENVVLDELRKGGFRQLVDAEIADQKAASVGGFTTALTAAQARRLGTLTQAEVILIGQVIVSQRGAVAALGPDWRSCSANLSARAVNTDDGGILATVETSQNAAQLDDLTCGKEAIKKAAKKFTEQMVQKIGERWSQDVSGGNAVHVTVHKVGSLKAAGDFRGALAQQVRGVKSVAQRSYASGTQELDVTVTGSAEQLAEELEARKLGRFSVKVTAVTANTVDVELGQE